jgi:hypothetical protein
LGLEESLLGAAEEILRLVAGHPTNGFKRHSLIPQLLPPH